MKSRRWDEYVISVNPNTGLPESIRCYGPGTAEAIAQSKRNQGYDKVQIEGVRADRKKESQSVHHGRLSSAHRGGRRN